jgi:hydroxymethylglutaryl-CoA reductase
LAVTVMIVVAIPSAVNELGLAEIVELAALAGH